MSRRRFASRWYHFARAMGCNRRLSVRIWFDAWVYGPEHFLEQMDTEDVSLPVSEEYVENQRQASLLQ